MKRSELLAQLLGEDEVFSVVSKFIFGEAGGGQDIPGLEYMMFGGSGYTENKILVPRNGWQMLEGELIIIPKTIRRNNKEHGFEHLKMDQAVTSRFGDPKSWKEKQEFNNK